MDPYRTWDFVFLRSPRVIATVSISLLVLSKMIPWCGCTIFCLYFICWTFGVVSTVLHYEWCCYAHLFTSFCVECVFISLTCTPRRGISGSHGNSISNLLKNCQTGFHRGCNTLHPHQEWQMFQTPHILTDPWASQVVPVVRDPPSMQGARARPLVGEGPLEEGMAPTPVFLPGKCHGQRSLVGLQRARLSTHTHHQHLSFLLVLIVPVKFTCKFNQPAMKCGGFILALICIFLMTYDAEHLLHDYNTLLYLLWRDCVQILCPVKD